MSKKIAAGASRLVLDVKVGEGAFMEDLESATVLARAMMRLGDAAGLPTTCMLAPMDEPLGCAVGNALEVAEAVATLAGEGPADLTEHCLIAAGLMLGDRGPAEEALRTGRAASRLSEWIAAQGGDPDAELPRAPDVTEVRAERTGTVERCGSRAIAEAAMHLGAGRARKEDAVDHAVGIVVHRKRGDRVEVGDALGDRPFTRSCRRGCRLRRRAALVSDVTRLTRWIGAAWIKCVFSARKDKPMPMPSIARGSRNCHGVSVGSIREMRKAPTPTIVNPTSTSGLAPIRSYNRPPIGMKIPAASACGRVHMPALNAVMPISFCMKYGTEKMMPNITNCSTHWIRIPRVNSGERNTRSSSSGSSGGSARRR